MWVCISSSFFQAVCFIAKSGCQDLRILCSTELQLKFYPNVHLTLDMWLKKSLRDTFISVTAHLCDESSKGSIHSKKKNKLWSNEAVKLSIDFWSCLLYMILLIRNFRNYNCWRNNFSVCWMWQRVFCS